jgi:hypothetical protein
LGIEQAMMTKTTKSRLVPQIVTTAALVVFGLFTQGCMDSTILEYQPLTRSLDGKSELHISTYPAGFPRETLSIPFLYKALRTPESVYFQVFVRAVDKKAGPNPNIETIRIRSLTYQFPGQNPVELITDYNGYFWMQGSPKYNPGGSSPVPFNENWYMQLRIDLTVNGQNYLIDEEVQAVARRNIRPLLLYALE